MALTSEKTKSTAVRIDAEIPALERLETLLSEWAMIPREHGEKFVLRRFRLGHFYDNHFDYFEDTPSIAGT